MNLKQTLAAASLLPGLMIGNPSESKAGVLKNETKSEVSDILINNDHRSLPEADIVERPDMEEILLGSEEISDPLIETKAKPKLGIVNINELKGTPLEMKGIYAKDDLKQFFGLNQYKDILIKYNENAVKRNKDGKLLTDKNLYTEATLEFPLVFDSLIPYFPSDIEDFIKTYPEFEADIGIDKTVLIIKKIETGKFALCYYKEGKLLIATHVSPGKKSKPTKKMKKDKKTSLRHLVMFPGGEFTPEGVFSITKSSYYKFKKSRTFELSPMPYAMQIFQGVFCHHGQDVDGTKRSHGCVRVPGFYQKALYENISNGTKVVIKGTKS